MKKATKPPKAPGTPTTDTDRPSTSTQPASTNAATTALRSVRPAGSNSDNETIPQILPKAGEELTKEEKELAQLRNRMYGVVNDAVSYMHEVVTGSAKGNRTRMRACESFIRFLPQLDHVTGSQSLHLHLAVPRPDRKATE